GQYQKERLAMDKDLSLIYAFISTCFGMAFGVEIGVFWFALAGSFISIRFCETKTTLGQLTHVLISTFLACTIMGAIHQKYPDLLPLRFTALFFGFVGLLLAEKVYHAVRDTHFTEKLNTIIDKVIAKWIP
ncbi:MAG: hypothetical protein V4605_00890, partial [Pseudomonadota bacterium]